MEMRSVTSHYHSRKRSGTQQSFLTEIAICIVERWKKSMVYYFVSQCNHAQKSNTCQFFLFFSVFLSYWQDHSLLRSRKFAIMAT